MTEADELVDVVDAADRILGTLPRVELKTTASNYRVVHVLVLDSRSRLVLQRIASTKAAAFRLGSSVAGHVRSGESYASAACREFCEELGAVAPPLVDCGKTWLDEDGRRKFIGVFLARSDGPFRPDPSEVAGLEALSLPEARRLCRVAPETFSPTFHRVFRHVEGSGVLPD